MITLTFATTKIVKPSLAHGPHKREEMQNILSGSNSKYLCSKTLIGMHVLKVLALYAANTGPIRSTTNFLFFFLAAQISTCHELS